MRFPRLHVMTLIQLVLLEMGQVLLWMGRLLTQTEHGAKLHARK